MRGTMKLLRRILYEHAAVWTACGLAIAIAPGWVLHTLFNQVPSPDDTYVRICGVMSIGASLMMVLVAQKIEEVWWWSWAFAITDAAIATITGFHATLGSPAGSGSLLWWIFAAVSALLAAGLMAGLTRAADEKPFV
jgi:hypothetical protein